MLVLVFIVLLKHLLLTHCLREQTGLEDSLACFNVAVLCCIAHFTKWFWAGQGVVVSFHHNFLPSFIFPSPLYYRFTLTMVRTQRISRKALAEIENNPLKSFSILLPDAQSFKRGCDKKRKQQGKYGLPMHARLFLLALPCFLFLSLYSPCVSSVRSSMSLDVSPNLKVQKLQQPA